MPPASWRIAIAFVAVLIGLAITGAWSAHIGQASKRSAIVRLLVGGALAMAMAVTSTIGQLIGTTVG